MNTIRKVCILMVCCLGISVASIAQPRISPKPDPTGDQAIMIALLLDTSNSMDGLIDQAKSQLWKIVNELSATKCSNGGRPSIRIALYEYGNDGLSATSGYIRQVAPLTNDLDLISEKLFALKTNGGNEYCGQVIKTSLDQLAWSSRESDLKMIFIAGNEPFTQGEIPFRSACMLALEKDVIVNTIFCGDYDEGIRTDWKKGSDIAKGAYMSIQQDRKTVFIATPYDDKIEALNSKLNDTYVYYGSAGAAGKQNQLRQDDNSGTISRSNKVERAVAKSSAAYENSKWDLVDADSKDKEAVVKLAEKDLPAEMKGMTAEQRRMYVSKKASERQAIQIEISELNKKRTVYIRENTTKTTGTASLDDALLNAIRERAKIKRMTL